MTTLLIVEDEFLIFDCIARYLNRSTIFENLVIKGPAKDYPSAISLATQESLHLALIDIRLEGPKTGLDVARWLTEHQPEVKIIFLTSQVSAAYLREASKCNPHGYLAKPINPRSLCTTVALALSKQAQQTTNDPTLQLRVGSRTIMTSLDELLYVQADHVYSIYTFFDGTQHIVRETLAEAEARLPTQKFWRIHRSYIINAQRITSHTPSAITLGATTLPIARSKREDIKQLLDNK